MNTDTMSPFSCAIKEFEDAVNIEAAKLIREQGVWPATMAWDQAVLIVQSRLKSKSNGRTSVDLSNSSSHGMCKCVAKLFGR